MEQRNLKINRISAEKKTRKIKTITNNNTEEPIRDKNKINDEQSDIQKQMLSWDGMVSALSFSVPFVVVIAINLQSALALVAILVAVLLPVSMLRFSLREKLSFPDLLTVPICSLVSVGITAFAAVIIRNAFPQINDSMGIYIYLFSAYPVVAAVCNTRPARRLGNAVTWAIRNVLYFSCGALLTGIIREFLAYNRFMGLTMSGSFKLEAAKVPFFGFIVLAFVVAAATSIHTMIRLRFPQDAGGDNAEDVETADDVNTVVTDNVDVANNDTVMKPEKKA